MLGAQASFFLAVIFTRVGKRLNANFLTGKDGAYCNDSRSLVAQK